jgi:hypothetical protein
LRPGDLCHHPIQRSWQLLCNRPRRRLFRLGDFGPPQRTPSDACEGDASDRDSSAGGSGNRQKEKSPSHRTMQFEGIHPRALRLAFAKG